MNEKLKYCNYCAIEIPGKDKFCSDEHKERFTARMNAGEPIYLQISPGTVVESKRYDKITEVIIKYKNKMSAVFTPQELIRYEPKKGQIKKNTEEPPLF